MDQNKIGNFIAICRKEKNMTQQELADKLHVTDRAISNWENGRRMPDLSFFKPLCEIFNLSVSELMNGKRMEKSTLISSLNETVIRALHMNKRDKRKANRIIQILLLCLIILLFLLIFFFIHYKNSYPKIAIYHLSVSLSNPDKEYQLKKQASYTKNKREHSIYYYGIDSLELCDLKEECYPFKKALEHKQINMKKIKNYLESQYVLEKLDRFILYDGGTTIYENKSYSIIYCNTLEGNQDIYFGVSDMVNRLNGAYCGKSSYTEKTFTRTYFVVSAIEDEEEDFINVTLREFQGANALVKINKDSNIVVGKNYEFTFSTFSLFEDTIENIFAYSTLLKVKETDKVGLGQIQEKIHVNE